MPRASIVVAPTALLVALSGCDATHRDVSANAPYKDRIGQVCEVVVPLKAHGYTLKLEPNKKTDAVSIWNPGFSGPEVTFVVALPPGTRLTLLGARECANCLLSSNAEYRVNVHPEPAQFGGRPAYLRNDSLSEGHVRCAQGLRAA